MVRMALPPVAVLLLALGVFVGCASAQTSSQAAPAPAIAPALLPTQKPPTRADILRGEYGRYRANNDLLYYHLDIRVDPAKKSISGKNTIRFRMLKDDTRIQLDLYANLGVDKILLGQAPLKYEREINTVFVDFPETLRAGRDTQSISTTRACPKSRAASVEWRSARTRRATTGSTPLAREKAPAVWWPE